MGDNENTFKRRPGRPPFKKQEEEKPETASPIEATPKGETAPESTLTSPPEETPVEKPVAAPPAAPVKEKRTMEITMGVDGGFTRELARNRVLTNNPGWEIIGERHTTTNSYFTIREK